MTDKKRRQFVTFMGASTVAVPLGALITTLPSQADDLPLVDEASPAAVNWEYKAATDIADKMCMNCALYQGPEDAVGGPCPLFPGNNVHAEGWCKAWAPKPG